MAETPDDRDPIEERLDRLEATLDELRDAVAEDDRIDPGRTTATTAPPASETALRLTERLVVPAAVAALEVNVRALEFVQDRLEELERREAPGARPASREVSDRVLDRLDEALASLEESIAAADLPRDADARRLLERARGLNAEVRDRARQPGSGPRGPDVVRIDVEEELEDIRDEVDAEGERTGDVDRLDEDDG